MERRPLLALVLRQILFALFQFLAYNSYGWPALVGAWVLVFAETLIDVRLVLSKIIELAAQTAWFVFLLVALHAGYVNL